MSATDSERTQKSGRLPAGISGRVPSERVADLRRNQWPAWVGIRKWLHRLLKRVKVPGSKCIHGLRSTVTTKLYEAGVDGETRRRLLGHAGKDEHEARYLRPQVKVLREHLEKLDFRLALGDLRGRN